MTKVTTKSLKETGRVKFYKEHLRYLVLLKSNEIFDFYEEFGTDISGLENYETERYNGDCYYAKAHVHTSSFYADEYKTVAIVYCKKDFDIFDDYFTRKEKLAKLHRESWSRINDKMNEYLESDEYKKSKEHAITIKFNINKEDNIMNTTTTINNVQEDNTMNNTTTRKGFMAKLRESVYADRARIAAEKASKKIGDVNINVTKKVAYGQGYATAMVSENMANFEIKRREEALKSYKEGVQKAIEKKAERKENKVINKALANVQ